MMISPSKKEQEVISYSLTQGYSMYKCSKCYEPNNGCCCVSGVDEPGCGCLLGNGDAIWEEVTKHEETPVEFLERVWGASETHEGDDSDAWKILRKVSTMLGVEADYIWDEDDLPVWL